MRLIEAMHLLWCTVISIDYLNSFKPGTYIDRAIPDQAAHNVQNT